MITQGRKVLDSAIEIIGDYIIANQLKPGSKLPREMELSKKLGISRNVLREALQHYRTLGIIKSRPRTGAEIGHLIPKNAYAGYLPFIAAERIPMHQVAEMRFALEAGMAPLIIEAATEKDIAKLRTLVHEMAEPISRDERNNKEVNFHLTLLKIPNNKLIEGLIPLLIDFFSEYRRRIDQGLRITPKDIANQVQEHEVIIDAIEKRDGDELTRILHKHNESYLKLFPQGD